jgi:hypothetical protein
MSIDRFDSLSIKSIYSTLSSIVIVISKSFGSTINFINSIHN